MFKFFFHLESQTQWFAYLLKTNNLFLIRSFSYKSVPLRFKFFFYLIYDLSNAIVSEKQKKRIIKNLHNDGLNDRYFFLMFQNCNKLSNELVIHSYMKWWKKIIFTNCCYLFKFFHIWIIGYNLLLLLTLKLTI